MCVFPRFLIAWIASRLLFNNDYASTRRCVRCLTLWQKMGDCCPLFMAFLYILSVDGGIRMQAGLCVRWSCPAYMCRWGRGLWRVHGILCGRGEWRGWGCAILYGRGEWLGWVCYVWFGYDARCYVWLLMGCVGAFVVVPGCSWCHYTVWADTILSGNAVVWYPPIHVLLSSAGFRVIMSHVPYS